MNFGDFLLHQDFWGEKFSVLNLWTWCLHGFGFEAILELFDKWGKHYEMAGAAPETGGGKLARTWRELMKVGFDQRWDETWWNSRCQNSGMSVVGVIDGVDGPKRFIHGPVWRLCLRYLLRCWCLGPQIWIDLLYCRWWSLTFLFSPHISVGNAGAGPLSSFLRVPDHTSCTCWCWSFLNEQSEQLQCTTSYTSTSCTGGCWREWFGWSCIRKIGRWDAEGNGTTWEREPRICWSAGRKRFEKKSLFKHLHFFGGVGRPPPLTKMRDV